MLECYAQYIFKMDINCFDDDVDRGDQKGGIQGGAHHTAAYLDERCRYDRPSGSVNTLPERVSTNILVERGVEWGAVAEWLVRRLLNLLFTGSNTGGAT